MQQLVQGLLNVAQALIILSVLIHWLGVSPHSHFARVVSRLTEPMMMPVRWITNMIPGPFDWAPMLTICALMLLQRLLITLPL